MVYTLSPSISNEVELYTYCKILFTVHNSHDNSKEINETKQNQLHFLFTFFSSIFELHAQWSTHQMQMSIIQRQLTSNNHGNGIENG